MSRPPPDGLRKGHRIGGLFLLSAALCACAPTPAAAPRPPGVSRTPRHAPFPDPLDTYQATRFLVGSGRFAPIGRLAFLPGPSDSTYAILALALSNSALRFRREAPGYVARYHVTLSVGDAEGAVARTSSTEEVRVATFRETSRRDESVVFQTLLALPPGVHPLRVSLDGLALSAALHLDTTIVVPSFGTPRISDPITVYRVRPRSSRAERPDLILSPRSTAEFAGGAEIGVYVEAVALPDTTAVVDVLDHGSVILTDTMFIRAAAESTLKVGTVWLSDEPLPPGALTLRVRAPLAAVAGEAPLLVALRGDWLFRDFDELLSHLRYAGRPEELDALRAASPAERARLLRGFLLERDPQPDTEENEFLRDYLRRLQEANDRFAEVGTPGWLTDRGAVYVSIGPPDEVVPGLLSEEGSAGGQVWLYERPPALELRLVFVDTSGNGTYRLTADSRRAYQRAVQTLHP